MTRPAYTNEDIPLNATSPANAGDDHADESEAEARLALDEKETAFVEYIVTGVATPLAKAFRAMPSTGLLTSRYGLYTLACNAILQDGGHVVRFHRHACDIPALLDHVWHHVWRTADKA